MRASPPVVPGRIRVAAFAGLAVLAVLAVLAGPTLSCTPDGPTGAGGVRRLEVEVPSTVLRPGFHVRALATAFDANGDVVRGRAIIWRSLTPATLAVSAEGLLLALAPGTGIARASVGTVSAEIQLALVNPPVATLTLDADTVLLLLPGGGRVMSATARDAEGIGILGAVLSWESTATRIAPVSSAGLVSAQAVGTARVLVRAEAQTAQAVVRVTAPISPGGPQIAQVTPASVSPGQVVAITGANFGPTPSANVVLIDGVPVAVTSATATQLLIALPAAGNFACEPTSIVALQLSTSAGIGVAPVTLQVATPRTLSVGQSLVFATTADSRCNEFSPDGGRYLVTVQNVARALGSGTAALTVTGTATAATGAPFMAPLLAAPATLRIDTIRPAPPSASGRAGSDRTRAALAAHAQVMVANRAILDAVRPQTAQLRPLPQPNLSTPALGAILPVRVANLAQPNFCNSFTNIGARAVFVGDRIVILEDTLAVFNGQPTLRGQMDNLFVALGAELETTAWPLLQTFGDPLVMDSRLDANGRVFLVFTPQMNQQLGGAALAAVVNCDFFPRAQFASSNVGEFVYAQVPTSAAAGFAPGTRTRWLHEMRGTITHELKHVTSFGERIVRGQPLEESWLEEATARHAEELFARAVFGTQRNGNHGFAATLACELGAANPALPSCAQAPRAMLPHFEALWDYLDAPESRSPLGPADVNDFSFYGSAWALTRWILDQQGIDEPAFFTGLTRSGQTGLANLEARAGRTWEEMFGEWSLAMATDDRPGLTPADPRLRFPSWNLTGIFGDLCIALSPCPGPAVAPARFTRAHPLRATALTTGAFVVEAPTVSAGGFLVLDVRPPATGFRQLLALGGYRGAALAATVRLAIIRIE